MPETLLRQRSRVKLCRSEREFVALAFCPHRRKDGRELMPNSEHPPTVSSAEFSSHSSGDTQSLPVGLVVGNYVVESFIGGGGMAQVYRVRHSVLGTRHALKVLDARYRGLSEVRQRFLSEGQIAAQLHHQNVVRVTDAVATTEVAGLVMELVEGPTLDDYIAARGKPLTWTEVRELFIPVLDAIAEAHRQGIIHRDIKPANILLSHEHGRSVPKVTDFGIAKILRALPGAADAIARGQTRADSRMGTLAYMSPEQVRGAKDVTALSDIFSLGATLYELCTGDLAFDGNSDYEIMSDIVAGRIRQPSKLGELEPVLGAAICKALSVAPSDRFASCEEFALALMVRSTQPSIPRSGSAAASVHAHHVQTPSGASSARPSTGAPGSTHAVTSDALVRRCPMCNEEILASARKCKHCMEYINPVLARSAAHAPSAEPVRDAVRSMEKQAASLTRWIKSPLMEKRLLTLKAASQSLVLPGLGQLLHDQHRVGGLILGGYCLLHWLNVSSGWIVLSHCVAGILTAMNPPRPDSNR